MEKVIQYETSEDRELIIEENHGLFLIREEQLMSGNFLVFSDVEPEVVKVTMVEPVQPEELITLQTQILDVMQGIADLWVEIQTLKERGGLMYD